MRAMMRPPILLCLALGAMWWLHRRLPLAQWLDTPYHWIGMLPLLAGLCISAWHARLFRRVGTNIDTFKEPGRLVTDGLFRRTRNPMYLGFVITLTGVALLMGSAMPWLIVLAFFVVTDLWYIRFEERAMLQKFGPTYVDYQANVRRWL